MDEKFLDKVMEYVDKHLAEPDLSVDALSREIGISTTHLYRKIKSITGLSTNSLIRKARLRKAAAMLAQKQGAISQIMYEVGFSNHSYFAKCFQEEFGVLPKEYAAGR